MKISFVFFFWLLTVSTILGQSAPQSIPRLTERHYPHEWYDEQVKAWEQVVTKEPQNTPAWFEFYKALRYSGRTFPHGDTTNRRIYREKIQKMILQMEQINPNSFEYHYIQWWDGGNEKSRFPHLEKAYQLRPNDPHIYSDLVAYYELMCDHDKVAYFMRKWGESQLMPPTYLEYHYNLLLSLEPNAILISGGDNDTYPVWMLQYVYNVRPDVLLLNVSLMSAPEYRQKMLTKYKLLKNPDYFSNEHFEKTPYMKWANELLQALAQNQAGRPFYTAITLSPKYIEEFKDSLYLVGLANKYCEKRFDNLAELKRNWKQFRLDYLDQQFYIEKWASYKENMAQLNLNYLPAIMLLYEHHQISDERQKAQEMLDLALKLGKKASALDAVMDYLSKNKQFNSCSVKVTEDKATAKETHEGSSAEAECYLFPNPMRDEFTLYAENIPNAEVFIYNLSGQEVAHYQQVTNLAAGFQVNVSSFPVGTYTVKIQQEGKSIHRKFLLQR